MKKLNVLLLGSQIETGGAQKMLFQQAKWFTDRGHTVSVIFLYDKEGKHQEWNKKHDISIINLNAKKHGDFFLFNFARILRGIGHLSIILFENKFDVIETFTIHSNVFAIPIAWFLKIPARVATHHGFVEDAPRWLEILHGLILNSRFCSKLVAVSEAAAQIAVNKERVNQNKIIVIKNGINVFSETSPDSKIEIMEELGFHDDTFLILSIGRLVQQKGVEILLSVAKKTTTVNQNVRFAIAGDGALKKKLLKQRDELGLQKVVSFLGIRNDIPALLSAADIFLMTSQWEGLSIAMLEAMSMAKPIVATKFDGVEKTITNGINGVIVPKDDVDTISAALVSLAGSEKLRRQLGKAAQETFTRDHTIDQACLLYEGIFWEELNEGQTAT